METGNKDRSIAIATAKALLPDEAIDKGRSVRAWLDPSKPCCGDCLGTGFGIDTDFDEGCIWCSGEGFCVPASEGA